MDLVILDTNIILSALRSKRGASYLVLKSIGTDLFKHAVSTSLVLEYEDVLLRNSGKLGLTRSDIEVLIDYIISTGVRVPIHFRWRPTLSDPGDDHLLEVAVAAGANMILTYNKKDFEGVEKAFNIRIVDALEFLKIKGVIP